MRSFSALLACALVVAAAIAVVRGRAIREVEADAVLNASAGIAAPRDPRTVASVRLVGEGLPVAALERALTTRVGAPVRVDELARDRAAMVAALQARGYLSAAVTDVHVAWADGAHVTFDVAPGGLYRVAEVHVEGALARRFAELAVVPTLLADQPWQPDRAAANVSLLQDWLARRSVRAEVTAHRVVDHVRHTVDVTFVVDVAP